MTTPTIITAIGFSGALLLTVAWGLSIQRDAEWVPVAIPSHIKKGMVLRISWPKSVPAEERESLVKEMLASAGGYPATVELPFGTRLYMRRRDVPGIDSVPLEIPDRPQDGAITPGPWGFNEH